LYTSGMPIIFLHIPVCSLHPPPNSIQKDACKIPFAPRNMASPSDSNIGQSMKRVCIYICKEDREGDKTCHI
jgi:hypothetical protein